MAVLSMQSMLAKRGLLGGSDESEDEEGEVRSPKVKTKRKAVKKDCTKTQ